MWHLLLANAREKLQDWRQQHNEDRPRSATGYNVPITPHNPGGAFGPAIVVSRQGTGHE